MSQVQIDVSVANRFIASLSKSLQALCHGCMEFDSGIEILGYINLSIDKASRVDYVLNEKVMKSTAKSMTFVSNSFLAKKEKPEFVPIRVSESESASPCVKQEIDIVGEDDVVIEEEDFCEWSISVKQDPELCKSDNYFDVQSSASKRLLQMSMPSTFREDFTDFPCDIEERYQPDELLKEGNFGDLQCEAENSNTCIAKDDQQLSSGEKDIDEINHDTANDVNEDRFKSVNDPEPVSRSAKMNDETRTSWDSDQANVMQSCRISNGELESNHLLSQNHSVREQNAQVCQNTKNKKVRHCHFCQQTFASRLDYHKHLGQFHGSEMPFTCSLCGRGYLTAPGLYRHAMAHAGKSYPCPVCYAPFNQKQNMKRHLGNIHSLCQCPKCLKTFSIMDGIYKEHTLKCDRKIDKPKARLDYHKHLNKFHGSEMPFICSLCGRGYLTAPGLYHHAMVHAGKSYPCPVCSAPFNQKQNMKRHLGNIHSLCQCPKCLKTFSITDGIYKQHVLGCHRKIDKPKTRK